MKRSRSVGGSYERVKNASESESGRGNAAGSDPRRLSNSCVSSSSSKLGEGLTRGALKAISTSHPDFGRAASQFEKAQYLF